MVKKFWQVHRVVSLIAQFAIKMLTHNGVINRQPEAMQETDRRFFWSNLITWFESEPRRNLNE